MFYVGDFVESLNNFIEDEVPREFVRRQVDAAVFLLERLRYYTPKPPAKYATGHMYWNWRIDSGAYLTSNESGTRYGNGEGNTSAERITPEGFRQRLSSQSLFQGTGIKGFGNAGRASTIYVYNNVRYAQANIDGNSTAAPQGWFDIAIAETRDYMTSKGWV